MQTQVDTKLYTKMLTNAQSFRFQPWLDITLFFKHTYICFGKHRPDIDMSNNYVLLFCFPLPCLLVCFVVHFGYFIIAITFERMWRDDYLHTCSVHYIINISCIWYIACVDW